MSSGHADPQLLRNQHLKYTTILVLIMKQDSTKWEKTGLNGSPEGLNGIVPKAWPEKDRA